MSSNDKYVLYLVGHITINFPLYIPPPALFLVIIEVLFKALLITRLRKAVAMSGGDTFRVNAKPKIGSGLFPYYFNIF